ncbi:MAG: hypothetical protein JAY74_21410, partial [Candidatus Thiodiazotropha taylori]|nr:hypothetical protein [Candidatus Thiodiazotropha taylori]
LLPEKKRLAYGQLTASSSLYKLCTYELNPGFVFLVELKKMIDHQDDRYPHRIAILSFSLLMNDA